MTSKYNSFKTLLKCTITQTSIKLNAAILELTNKKFELMLTRRAKAYSSCEWYRLVSQPKIAKKSIKTLYFGI